MRNLNFGLITILCFLFQIHALQAQEQKGELKKAKKVSAEISPNEKHHYTINLGADQFAFFKLMQQGVDMKITTYDPKGNKLKDFDSPNGKNGARTFFYYFHHKRKV